MVGILMSLDRLRCLLVAIALLLPVITPLTPRRHLTSATINNKAASSKTSLPVALEPPVLQQIPIQTQRSFVNTKNDDKEAHEYRWLTWLYQHWKDVPYGKLDSDICKQILPALTAYGRRQTSQSAQQAEELLDRYIAEYRAGNHVIPLENTAFHAVMNAYSKSAQPEQAQKVLQKMTDLSKSEEECFGHLQPDVFSFTILATAWARSRHPDAADKAERLLHHMEQNRLHVTTLTYNVVLNAIAVSHDPHKASRAAKIVRKMQQLVARGHHPHCQPDLYTYQSWIHACSRTRGGVPQTMQIFRFLDEQAAAGNIRLRPNAYCFAAAIHAWAYSSEPQKAMRAYELLQDMRQRFEIYGQKSCRPNVVVFTSVINACVKPAAYKDKEIAFEIAQLVFEELVRSPYGAPNFLTYAAFLHVCGTALEDEKQRDSHVRRIFGMCRQYGCVGKIVLQKLEETASQELFCELMGPYETWDEIPTSWKRRVKGERFKPQAELDAATVVNNYGEAEGDKQHRGHSDLSKSTSKSLRIARPSRPVSFHEANDIRWEIQFL
eukprot:scaffold1818_cov162-Amphora_coffeaeformis.AAC.1